MAILDHIGLYGTNYEIADAQGRQNFSALQGTVEHTTGAVMPTWEAGGMYAATGIEYNSNTQIRTGFIPVTPGDIYRFDWTIQKPLNIYGFAANTPTSSGVNERTAYKSTPYASQPLYYTIPAGVNYIRLQIEAAISDDKPAIVNLGGSILLNQTLSIKTRMEDGTDLDTVTASGVYLLGTNGNYGNAPSGLTYGFLTVKTINVITCQTVETPSGNFARFFDGSAWGAWAAR